MTKPSKARIRQSFDKAAATYDGAAALQRTACQLLLQGLPAKPGVRCWLDAGCGTGHILPQLQTRHPEALALALDLAPGMLERIGTPCCRISGDLEHLPFADASIDLYWSSLAIQWCDLRRALAEARRVIAPGGHLAIATLGPATFHEMRDAFARIDPHRHTLAFHTADEIAAAARARGFAAVLTQATREVLHYPDLRSLLRAVKAVGANQVGDGRRNSLLGRAAFARLEAAYNSWRQPAGLPLTYEVITLHCSR